MANEATVNSSLQIRVGSLVYASQPSSFKADVSTAKGPSPGAIAVSTYGTEVDLSELTQPGLTRVMNLSEDYKVSLGPRDPDTAKFYPLLDFLPGETYSFRLSSDIYEEYDATGTGTGSPTNTVWLKAFGGDAVVLFEAFES